MAKYHIKKDGTPGVCRAQNGNCPFGGESEHFPTKEEAQNYADKRHEAIEQRNICLFLHNLLLNDCLDFLNKFLPALILDF